MSAIELPPIYVTATQPGYSSPSGGQPFPGPNPALVMVQQQQERNTFYAQGYWREMLMKICNEQAFYMTNGKVPYLTAAMSMDMGTMAWADTFSCKNPGQSPAQALTYVGIQVGKKAVFDYNTTEFSGGTLSPTAALSHFVMGKGATAKTNINNLGLNPSATPIPMLEAAFAAAQVGSSPVFLDKVPYNTSDDSWLTASWLGNITLKIEGVVNKDANGRISFTGTARAYNDIYDANPSNFRSVIGESATSVLAAVQEYMHAQPYQIAIEGSLGFSINR